jgi:uncharacterized protein YgbK (DUF1537 family)
LAEWAAAGALPGVLAAGASEFFGAYLRALGHPAVERRAVALPAAKRCGLFVCGSTSAGSRAFCRESEARGLPVLRLPMELLQQSADASDAAALVDGWAGEIAGALQMRARAVAAIDRPLCSSPEMPQVLGGYLSQAIEQVLGRVAVRHVCAEGGATAAALVRRMGWTRMRVCREWATGVATLEVQGADAPLISMKPGSYTWPEALLAQP